MRSAGENEAKVSCVGSGWRSPRSLTTASLSAVAPVYQSTREIVRGKVLPVLKDKLKGTLPEDQRQKLELHMNDDDEAHIKALCEQNNLRPLLNELAMWIQTTSEDVDGIHIGVKVARAIAAEASEAIKAALKPETDAQLTDAKENLELLKTAFTAKYVGNAHTKFEEYLWRCWKIYTPTVHKAPYVAVVQSSGFGKSRMLYELGVNAGKPDSNMKVMYMCTRLHKSTGFPVATHTLREWLFAANSTVETLAERLEAIYHYAVKHWDTVQDEWLQLFTDSDQDVNVARELEKTRAEGSTGKTSPTSGTGATVKDVNAKMVVLVIDEARALLNAEMNQSWKLRHALVQANNNIGPDGGIFGVLVDTNSKVSDLTPPLSTDPSSRTISGDLASFPPFVLTHTMDIKWKEYCSQMMKQKSTTVGAGRAARDDGNAAALDGVDCGEGEMDVYKSVVLKGGQAAWHALTCMGRPLWASTLTPKRSGKGNLPARTSSDLVSLAANKLMLGLPPGEKSYTEVTMFGVASMLCRLGVRPYSTSALASRTVADFMAVLAYVSHERDGCLSSYASDPVLALGAMRVWYAGTNALADHILPQLTRLMLDEVLDTGGVGEMVARILMLLAMDKCVMKGRPILECELTGQFVSVASFLRVLDVGEDTPVLVKGMARADDEVREAFLKWQQHWGRWEMGFNHFIQLELEPNESTLWQLLGRRAAGPQGYSHATSTEPIW